MATMLCMCLQVQLDGSAYNVVLAALVEAEQLEGSLSLMTDMQDQGLQAEVGSCDCLVMLLLMAGQLQVAHEVVMVCGLLTPLFCQPLHYLLTGPLT